jgi:hypothetical protein
MRTNNWKPLTLFTSAAMAGRIMGRKCAAIIRDQPGYRRGEEMAIMKATSGGFRLFVRVSGKWMDGSLNDLPGVK